ncbi:hypothetical protein ANN_17445 [Periplaneta americana]|uniref:Uncharacterized protein n=1 Tax=Periplaneta americana TaxID=6978 RepID=A0ABQ8SSZ0_PERAM|nr:hypothetical protein ANN_17445 [Periplaneta americana]
MVKVKRACGQARWAGKDDQDGETPTGHHHGDTLLSGQQEVLGVTFTQGHISTGLTIHSSPPYLFLLILFSLSAMELLTSSCQGLPNG